MNAFKHNVVGSNPSGHDQAIDELSAAILKNLGIEFRPSPSDKFQRFPAPGKDPSNTACWVYFSPDASYATYGSHITGEKYTWQNFYSSSSNHCSIPIEDVIAEKKRLEETKAKLHAQVGEKSRRIIGKADVADPNHPYLKEKKVRPHDLYQFAGNLLVPLEDQNGVIHNIQRIFPDGTKFFSRGGRVKGVFARIGDIDSPTCYVCEGWATAATICEETGCPVVASMNAGNLLPVCRALRERFGYSIELIVAADNDHRTEGNPGLTKGRAAAEAISGKFVYPDLPCSSPDCDCTDFNDYHNCDRRKGGLQ